MIDHPAELEMATLEFSLLDSFCIGHAVTDQGSGILTLETDPEQARTS